MGYRPKRVDGMQRQTEGTREEKRAKASSRTESIGERESLLGTRHPNVLTHFPHTSLCSQLRRRVASISILIVSLRSVRTEYAFTLGFLHVTTTRISRIGWPYRGFIVRRIASFRFGFGRSLAKNAACIIVPGVQCARTWRSVGCDGAAVRINGPHRTCGTRRHGGRW